MRTIRTHERWQFALSFDYDPRLNDLVKGRGGRFNRDSREWVLSFRGAEDLTAFAEAEGFHLSPDTGPRLHEMRQEDERRRRDQEWEAHPPRSRDPVEICRWIGKMPAFVPYGFCGACDSDFRNEWCLQAARPYFEVQHLTMASYGVMHPSEWKILRAALAERTSYEVVRRAMLPSFTDRAFGWLKK